MSDVAALFERFDFMRNSGICSPTTRSLLDDAQAALENAYATTTGAGEGDT